MIPLSTTSISATRNLTEQNADPYDSTPNIVSVCSGVRAVISPPAGSAKLVGGTAIVYNAKLECDPTPLMAQDQVTDSTTGLVWTVLAVSQIKAIGQQFTQCQLRLKTGAQ